MAALSILLAIINKKNGYQKSQKIDFSYSEALLYASILTRVIKSAGLINTGGIINPSYMFLQLEMARYNVYRCKDGQFFALAAVEEKFFKNAVTKLGIEYEFFHGLASNQDRKDLI